MKKVLLLAFMLGILVPVFAFASFDKNLASGSKGSSVSELQTFLTAQKLYSGPITGTFGSLTKKAVIDFQKKYGIKPASGSFISLTRVQANKLNTIINTKSNNSSNTSTNVVPNVSNISFTPKTGYQICSETFPNETWDGTMINGKYNCVCITGYVLNSIGTACQIDDSTQRYQTQYQIVQAKIKPLQDQYNSLSAVFLSQECMGLAGGETATKCTLNANQGADVSEYENAIQSDLFTPVTDNSIIYENKLDDLHQQIFQAKMDYHQNIADLSGSGIDMSVYNGRLNNLTTAVNAKIDSLNQQIQFIFSEYKMNVTPNF
ncbi:MAG: peptidoglycan-binding protein [bacterium]